MLKAVGPIKNNKEGLYKFDDIIYFRSAKYLSVDNIKLQYIDVSVKVISKSEVQKIRVQDWQEYGERTINN